MPSLRDKLRNRRPLIGSLVTVTTLLLLVIAIGAGALNGPIKGKMSRMLRHKRAELQDLIGQAESKVRDGDHIEAVAMYLFAMARNPARQRRHEFFRLKQRTRMGLSTGFARIGKRRRAREVAEAAVREEPEYWLAHKTLGDVLRLSRKPARAEKHYIDALRINPIDGNTLQALTELLVERDARLEVVAAYRTYLEAYVLGSLKVWLDDELVLERDVVMNGSWQRLHIPFSGARRLRLRCLFEDEPVDIWLGVPRGLARDPMHDLLLREDAPKSNDVVEIRIAGGAAPDPSATIEVAGGTKFLAFEFAVSKPWTEPMTRQLRRAVRGNPR